MMLMIIYMIKMQRSNAKNLMQFLVL
jgi:hypothetical protein